MTTATAETLVAPQARVQHPHGVPVNSPTYRMAMHLVATSSSSKLTEFIGSSFKEIEGSAKQLLEGFEKNKNKRALKLLEGMRCRTSQLDVIECALGLIKKWRKDEEEI